MRLPIVEEAIVRSMLVSRRMGKRDSVALP